MLRAAIAHQHSMNSITTEWTEQHNRLGTAERKLEPVGASVSEEKIATL